MKVTVTGATGNIGTALVRRLVAGGHEVTGVARRRPPWDPPGVRWVQADVAPVDRGAPAGPASPPGSDPALRDAFEGADAVVHLAWAFQPTHEPLTTWRVNVGGTANVLRAAADAGVATVVHASSIGAYSPGPKDVAVDEGWPTDGLANVAYGREKAYVERLVDLFESRHPGVRVVRVRPAFAFQESASSEQWRIFAGRLLPARAGPWLPVIPDTPRLRLQVVHSDDLADAFTEAIERPVRGAFNVATEPAVGPSELARAFGARVVPVPRPLLRAGVAAAWHLRLVPTSPHLVDLALAVPLMDTTRARDQLGWAPRHDAHATLDALVRGLRKDEGHPTPPLGR